jgi:LytS/YehU family sensor histidine kinase
VLAALGFATVAGLLMFVHEHLDAVARGEPQDALEPLVNELTGAYTFLLVLLPMLAAVRRFPITRRTWRIRLPAYAGLVVGLGVVQTLCMWASRSALFPLVGLGSYDYGILWWRFPMELGLQAIIYGLTLGLLHLWSAHAAGQAAQVRAAELETALTRARLEALEGRLEPHFLFNTINTISAVMYENVAEADRLLGQLADLLRASMSGDRGATVPIRDEIRWLEGYLGLMRERFGPRLRVTVDVDPDALDLEVPRFILQPLVENAIRHGVGARGGEGLVHVRVRRAAGRLCLEVQDDGGGLGTSREQGRGIGLSDTAARLELMYRGDHRFEIASRPEGGTRALIEVPSRPAHAA